MDLIQGYSSGEDSPAESKPAKRLREETESSQEAVSAVEPPQKKPKISSELLELPKFIFDDEEGPLTLNTESFPSKITFSHLN